MTAPIRILTASEPWAEYQLEDGTLLRFRLTACNFRLTGKRTAEGDPEYSFSHQLQVETHARPPADRVALHAAAVRQLRSVPSQDLGMPSDSAYHVPDQDCG